MSVTPWRAAAALVFALSLAGAAAAQPPPPPPPPPTPATAVPKPSVPAMPILAPQAAPQTEADKKLEEIRASDINEPDRVAMVPKLVQFIRENPDYPRLESAYSTLLGYAIMSRGDPAKVQAIADEALAKFPNPNSPVRARQDRPHVVAENCPSQEEVNSPSRRRESARSARTQLSVWLRGELPEKKEQAHHVSVLS